MVAAVEAAQRLGQLSPAVAPTLQMLQIEVRLAEAVAAFALDVKISQGRMPGAAEACWSKMLQLHPLEKQQPTTLALPDEMKLQM